MRLATGSPAKGTPMPSPADHVATSGSRRRAAARRPCGIALLLLIAIVGGCESAPTPNPAIEAPVEPTGAKSISGIASIADGGSGHLRIHVGIEQTDPPPSGAELRRGGCESTDVALYLLPMDPRNRFEWVGDLYGSLATIRPVAVIVLDIDGRPMGCALFPGL